MTIDERVRDALHAYADPIEPAPGSWDRIEARLDERLPRERRPRTPLLIAAVGILVIVALIAAAVVRDLDDQSSVTVDGGIGALMPARIAAVTTTGRVVVLDAVTGKVLDERAPAGTSSGEQVVAAPDGKVVYFGPRGFDQSCADRSLSKLTLDSPVRSIDPVAARGLSPAPSPDGRYLAFLRCSSSSTRPDEVVLRDLATNAETLTSAPSSMRLSGQLAFAGDSRHVLLGVGESLHRLDLLGGEALPGEDLGIAVGATPRGSRDDQYLVLKGSPGTVLVATGPQPFTASRLFKLPETSKQLATDASGDHVLSATVNGSLYRWSVGDDAPTKVADGIETAAWIRGSRAPEPKPEPEPTSLPPQRVLVLGTAARGGGSMEILPSTNGGGVGDMGSAGDIRAGSPVAVTPDGKFAYVVRKSVNSNCGDGDSIFRQPIASGARSGDEISNATAPAVSPDGKYLAYLRCTGGSDNATIVLRDLEGGSERETSGLFSTRLLEFAPDSRHVLVEGRADAPGPVQARELDLVGGETEPGRAIPASVTVTSYWGDESLLAINGRSALPSVVTVASSSGEVRQHLFDVSDVPGVITDVMPNRAGTAMLVIVDDARLFWWAPGMSAPVKLDEKMLTATWMPDEPSSPTTTKDALPLGIVAVRGNELDVLGAADGAQHSSLGTVQPGTAIAPAADGRDWILGQSAPPARCERSGARTQPALKRLDTSSGLRDDWVGGAYAPVTNRDDVVAYGYACDGRGLGLSNIRTQKNYRVQVMPRSSTSPRIRAVRPLGWSPDGRTLLYFVDVGSTRRLFAARFSPAFYKGARSRDVDIVEIGSPMLETSTMSGNDTVVGVLPSAPSVLIEYGVASRLSEPHRLTELPEPVRSIVADPSGRHFLVVTSSGELWRWSRGQEGPVPVAEDVTAVVWLPWS